MRNLEEGARKNDSNQGLLPRMSPKFKAFESFVLLEILGRHPAARR